MKNLTYVTKLLSLSVCLLIGITLSAQSRIAGTIVDESGESLIGANIIVQGTTEGTVTDFDGSFSFSTTQSFPLTVVVSFTGYSSQDITLDGPTSDLNVTLTEGVLLGDDVIISASRRREKIQEAPASVTVLSARKLEGSAQATDPTRNLINVPGVQITQQSAARINIELRGGVGLFGTGAFPIKDYRSLVGPGIGTFDSNGAGINNVDLARIEVVRGAGSALYGPGVTTGVVHFITKNPIDYPGTTIEVMGGELSTYGITARHAGVNASKKFGYKINASYKRGDEFTLDGSEGTGTGAGFTRQIDKFQSTVVQPGTTNGRVDSRLQGTPLLTLTPRADGNVMQDFWKSFSTDLSLEFRPTDNLSTTISGGYNNASAVFYNDLGEGLSQFAEYWAQARVQAGGLFAQLFYVTNDGGGQDETPTFLYQTGNRSPVGRDQIEAQLQYNFDTPSLLNGNWTIGADYRQAISDTEGLVYGKNEDDDGYTVVGGYVQGKFELGSKMDLIAAGRYDRFGFLGEGAFSPRAALVYKASPKHTFRASYNHATFAPTALTWNIDFPVNVVVPGLLDFWLAGQRNVQSFGSNPMIDITLPGVPDLPLGTPGLPLAVPYGAVAAPVIQGILAGFAANPAAAPLVPAVQQFFATYVPGGFTGAFVGVNAFDGTLLNNAEPTIKGQIGSTKTYELGYKGLFGDKLGASLDIYRITVNGASDFTQIGPLITLQGANVAGDLGATVGADFNAFLQGSIGLDAQTAGALSALVAGGFNQGGAGFDAQASALYPIFGAVESDQVPQDDGIVHVPAGYRIFDSEYTRWGADLGLEYYVSEPLSIFANYSWLNDTEFTVDQNDGSGQTFQTFLNTPKNKYRIGFNYAQEYGWRTNMSFQHDDEFNSNNGQYSGIGQAKNLVDFGIGHKLENGMSFDLTAQNLFDNEYRAFPNMPLIGRRILAKLTFDFGGDGPSDVDGDGVKDKKDACPNEAGSKEFMGCPDSDGDGIIDKDDKCPMAAGDILFEGCPDADGDGVIDNEDDCPNDAGELNGCPDADGDGVADKDDNCPNTAGTLNGCPDSDGDGVANKDDKCPNAAGPVGGCPDSDGDGVADKDDKCPNTSARTADGCPSDPDGDGVAGAADRCPNEGGIVDANGCPKDSDGDGIADNDDKCPNIGGNIGPDGCLKPVPAKAAEVFTRAIENVKFQTGRATLTRSSYSILNEVVSIMEEFPGLTLSIEGHTDDRGDDQKNMELSQTRAASVMKYLTDKGVDASRLRAVGIGELVPVASNDTAAGRAQNRRVELKATY